MREEYSARKGAEPMPDRPPVVTKAGRPVLGYLPVSLLEPLLQTALGQMAIFSAGFLLAGGHDLCAAMIGSPELLLRQDGYPPLLWMGGMSVPEQQRGLSFRGL